MFSHYVELVAYFRKQIFLSAAAAGALCLGISWLLLTVSPKYVASVTLNLQPSEEALKFNKDFMGVTQFNPATIIAQTQIERVLSRPVAERALDLLNEEGRDTLPNEPPTTFDSLKAAIRRNWNLLNYGYFVPPTERDRLVSDIMNATSVELIAGSYIMMVKITHEDPEVAARSANALTMAYIEQVRIEFAEVAAVVEETIAGAREDKNQELSELLVKKRELERAPGARNTEEERNMLLAARVGARQGQIQTLDAADVLQRELAELSNGSSTQSADGQRTEKLNIELATLNERARAHESSVLQIERRLSELDASEGELAALDRRIRETETDLSELQIRRNDIQLAREARMAQVQIINTARPPAYPSFPKVLVNTLVGTILGFILSLAPVIVLDVLDRRVRTSEDLRQVVGLRALPPVSRRLTKGVYDYLTNGAAPGRALREFSDGMARAIITVGRRRWPERRILVTAFGSDDDIKRLKQAVEAAVQLSSPNLSVSGKIEIVALPKITQVYDWKVLSNDLIVLGLRAGTVMDDEVKRVVDVEGGGTVETLLTVIT